MDQRQLRFGWLIGRADRARGSTPWWPLAVRVNRAVGFDTSFIAPASDAEISEIVTDREILGLPGR